MNKVYKFWTILLSIIGGGSLLYAIIVLISMGFQPSYLYFWLGLALLCLILVIGIRVTTKDGKIPPKWLVIPVEIVVLIFCFVFILIEAVIIHGGRTEPQENADYLIILGAKVNGTQPSLMLKQRIEAAAEYLKRNPNTIAIASGGKGSDENISEAQCIYEQLVALGIEPERILMENQSTSTVENLEFSARIIKENEDYYGDVLFEMNPPATYDDRGDVRLSDDGQDPDRSEQEDTDDMESYYEEKSRQIREQVEQKRIGETVVLTTTDFHMFRAMYLARNHGYENIYGNPAPSVWWLIPTNYTREFMAVMKDVVIKQVLK